jgi:hypothetical protein
MDQPRLSGPLLLLYQMPKTGSQTLEATLRQCPEVHQVVRCHFLAPAIARTMRKGLRSERASEAWKQQAHDQLRLMSRLSREVRRRKWLSWCGFKRPKLQVISGVREPVALGLSSIFENYFEQFSDLGAGALDYCRETLLHPKTLRYVQHWFDLELKRTTGIDVYRVPFPRRKGYAIYENRWVRVLVYRFEALDRLPIMLREFLGCKISAIAIRNTGLAKTYGGLYQQVQARLVLPPDFVAAQYASRMMQHFYTETERRAFQRRWTLGETEAAAEGLSLQTVVLGLRIHLD